MSWFRRKKQDDIALTVVQGDHKRDVSIRELALGNKLAGDALLAVLAEKGLVDPEDVRAKIQQLNRRSWRPRTNDQDDSGTAAAPVRETPDPPDGSEDRT